MVNVFVYHAHDRLGRCLAAVLRDCDGANRQFDYLAVETPESARRMQLFLTQQGLNPQDVALPFIVLVDEPVQQRSVLHGSVLQEWLGNLVDAYVRTAGISPAVIRDRILVPHLPSYVVTLLSFAAPALWPATPPPPPSEAPMPVPTPAGPREEDQPAAEDYDVDIDDDDNEGAVTSIATVPPKAEKRMLGGNGSATAVMLDAGKARERMVNARRQ